MPAAESPTGVTWDETYSPEPSAFAESARNSSPTAKKLFHGGRILRASTAHAVVAKYPSTVFAFGKNRKPNSFTVFLNGSFAAMSWRLVDKSAIPESCCCKRLNCGLITLSFGRG